MVVADVNIGPHGLDLPELIGRDGHAVQAAANEEIVHTCTEILYMNTVFQHQETQTRQYRSADYACLLRQEGDAYVWKAEPVPGDT